MVCKKEKVEKNGREWIDSLYMMGGIEMGKSMVEGLWNILMDHTMKVSLRTTCFMGEGNSSGVMMIVCMKEIGRKEKCLDWGHILILQI